MAAQVGDAIVLSDSSHTVEVADLAQECFDLRFTQADIVLLQQQAAPLQDVAAEHARLDRADALLVCPIYW